LSCWEESQDDRESDMMDEELLKGFVALVRPRTIAVNKIHVVYPLLLFITLNRT
jgi:hypothetical protein